MSGFRRARAGVLALISVPGVAASGESSFIDTAANVLAVFIIIVVPIGAIAIFWIIHILPEKIAEKRHHPQKEAIKVLCLLSLVFGGMLWPIAWLWAYSKPVLHKLAYGRDKHEDYYRDLEPAASERATHEPAPQAESRVRDLRDGTH